jgi:hypothetical protein
MVARQSLAAGLSGAHRMVADAEELTQEKIAQLADAAKRRRAVEMMAERHAETVRRQDLARDQAELDELAVTSKARNAARGIDALREERANPLRTGSGSAADREAQSRRAASAVAAEREGIDLADAVQAIDARRADLAIARHPADDALGSAQYRTDTPYSDDTAGPARHPSDAARSDADDDRSGS